MSRFLAALAAASLSGSAVILLLALISRSTRLRYTARWRCLAWLLLLVRMALPLPLPEGQVPPAPIHLPIPQDTIVYVAASQPEPSSSQPQKNPDGPRPPVSDDRGQTGGDVNAPNLSGTGASASRPQVGIEPGDSSTLRAAQGKSGFTLSLSQVLFSLWLAGAAAGVVLALTQHLRFLAWLRRWGRPVTDKGILQQFSLLNDRLGMDRRPGLRVCPGLKSPMLAGLARPVLLLPDLPLSEMELRNSLLHELTHFRRKDIWLRALALLVNAVHWFNPLCWYMVRLVERDTELACDEQALRLLPQEEHAAYGRTILDAAQRLRTDKLG